MVTVTVIFFGLLAEQAGQEKVIYSFPDGALYRDLLRQLGDHFGGRLSERIWDGVEKKFRPGILVVGEGRDFHRPETLLRDGEVIRILPLMGGG